MKSMIFVALALVAVAAAAPPVEFSISQTIQQFSETQPNGDYRYKFETDNGIAREEQGQVKSVPDEENKPHDVVVVRGSFSYVNDDGTPENINYYADETGYHAEGPSVPKAERR